MFNIMRRTVMRKNQVPKSKVKVTLEVKGQTQEWLSGAFLLHAWKDFDVNFHKCSPSRDGLSCARTRSLGLRSRSHLEVKGQTQEWLFGAFLLYAWKDFDVTWHKCSPPWDLVSCARTRSLEVKGQIQEYLCPQHFLFMYGGILMLPCTNVHHHELPLFLEFLPFVLL
jgi:hypothetical protein